MNFAGDRDQFYTHILLMHGPAFGAAHADKSIAQQHILKVCREHRERGLQVIGCYALYRHWCMGNNIPLREA
jgi:hypothetical protein